MRARHTICFLMTMDWELFRDRLKDYDVELFTLGGVQLSLSTVVKLALLVALLWWLAERVRRLIVGHALNHTGEGHQGGVMS